MNKCCHDVFWRKHNHKKSSYDSHITLVTKYFIYYLIRDLHSIAKSCQNSLIITKRTATHRSKAAQKKRLFLNQGSKVYFRWAFQDRTPFPRAKQPFISHRNPWLTQAIEEWQKLLPTNSNFEETAVFNFPLKSPCLVKEQTFFKLFSKSYGH